MMALSVGLHLFGALFFIVAAVAGWAGMQRERENMISTAGQLYRKLLAEYVRLGGDPEELEDEDAVRTE
jgi:hypothetical protein